MKRCCLIGYGYWGRIVERYVKEFEELEIVEICDPFYQGSANIDTLIAEERMDCAFVCTPVHTHYDIVRRLLLSGIHVFCEKPLCKGMKETFELVNIAEKHNTVLYVDYIYLVSQSIKYIKQIIGNYGDVNYIKMNISQFGNFYSDADVVEVIGVHMLSVLAFVFDTDIGEIKIEEIENIKGDTNGRCQEAALRFSVKGIPGMIYCSLLESEKSRKIEFICESGKVRFDMLDKKSVRSVCIKKTECGWEIGKESSVSYDETNNLRLAIGNFVRCLEQGQSEFEKMNHRISLIVADALKQASFLLYGRNENDK